MRYADPTICPDCRSALPTGVPVCGTCHLLVRHPLAVDLFRTLRRADTLLGELRTASDAFHDRPAPVPVAAPAATRVSSLGGPLVPPGADPEPKRSSTPLSPLPSPGPVPPAPPAGGAIPPGPRPPYAGGAPGGRSVASSSIPKVLLGLGAFCLLVAAAIFLAVSWSTLGVGGRTAVLGGMTAAAGTTALLLHRAGLRIAGESLIVVALGMVGLDVLGAGAAGWLGEGDGSGVTCAAGLVVAAAAVATSLLRIGSRPRLVAPQVVAGIGLVIGYVGAIAATDHRLIASHLLTAAAIAVVVLARGLAMPVLLWSAAVAGGLSWLGAATVATADALVEPDLDQLWVDGSGWSLLLTAAVLLAPGAVARQRQVLLAGGSCAATVVTLVLTLPSVDAGTVGVVALGVTAAWVAALALLPSVLRVVAIAPSALGSVILAVLSLVTASVAFARWAESARFFDGTVGATISGTDPVTEPLLLVPSLLVPLAFVALLTPGRGRTRLGTWSAAGGIAAGVGTATTLASYDVLLVLPVAVVALVALGAAALSLTSSGGRASGFAVVAVLIAGPAAVGAGPSAVLASIVGALGVVLAVVLAVLGRTPAARAAGGLAAAPLLGLTVTAVVHAVGGDLAWVAVPVLLAVGLLAVALARVEVEVMAAVVAVLVFPASLGTVSDAGAYTALWLTVAGFVVCATALVNESRRRAAWAGSALLVLASWVRLADLEVTAPEPYTLPLAAALVGFGLWRMRRSGRVGSIRALLPGLLLGTTPSLLWVLDDPVSLRALVLGAACLALTIAGAALRWSAPLLLGATVGATIVLRELGPYSGDFPKWVWIGLAGALLTVVGITWERRLIEIRRAFGFLGRLR